MSVLKGITDGCPNCGSKNIKPHGKRLSNQGVAQGYECKDCGKRSQGKYEKLTSIK